MTYSKYLNTKNVSQTEAVSSNQVKNNAGGFVFAVDIWSRLNRFLILGNEGGSYYQSEKALTLENSQNILECIKLDSNRVLNMVLEVSTKGRAQKNEPAIWVLSLLSKYAESTVRTRVHASITRVCRTGTHIFTFCENMKDIGGFGRGVRRGIGAYYANSTVENLAYQALKYRQRNGWTHRDVLRLVHTRTEDAQRNEVFKFLTDTSEERKNKEYSNQMLMTFLKLQELTGKEAETLALQAIAEMDFSWEMLPTELLTSVKVWSALALTMKPIALVRNLGKLSSLGILTELSDVEMHVISQLTNAETIKKSRIHPIQVLLAYKTYESGHGFKGDLSWSVNARVLAALDKAFYLAFDNVEATNKRFMLGVDVSGSMDTSRISGSNLSAREAVMALAMVTYSREPNCIIKAFSGNLQDVNLQGKSTLTEVIKTVKGLSFDRTDCAAPILYALEKKIKIDVFMVYTDNETYAGKMHPSEALKQYRKEVNPEARLLVLSTEATGFTIADPNDRGMLDISGFDSGVPNVIHAFATGEL